MVSLRKWNVNSFDFVAAYLNANINEEVWVRPPDALDIPKGFGCLLCKVLYGTKQAGHYSIIQKSWNNTPSTKTPLPAKCNLTTLPETATIVRPQEFISTIGAISYVATGTRPDISFAVNLLELHAKRPGDEHWKCLQHLLGYVSHTKNLRLCLCPQQISPTLDIWSDASWGGEFSWSTHGYLAQLGGCSISWCAKKLTTVVASSCHAEFMALGIAAMHGKWLKNLLDNITDTAIPLRLFRDNTSAIHIAEDSLSNKRTKHSDREYFITNQLLRDKVASLEWVSSGNMSADIMTKPLGSVIHQRLCGQVLCSR
ncbi:hypothetical protein O181_003365 [Austropuccinia psidii MF-1]|uniref:Reverse transcriptase Ty1/copia-type domain-containing protein n=1 Tax=Austropuccinia psidii MF-1 TaxID=1389203 RepID=A0A9Q3BEW2_9BASI|nr:hypothetical protein [Austropuccinia psidii MF-1]